MRLLCILIFCEFALTAQDLNVRALEFAGQPRLIDCAPAATLPCFRVVLKNPGGFRVGGDLTKSVSIRFDDLEITPFLVAPAGQAGIRRVSLLLIDVSGSMAQSMPGDSMQRMQAAQQAVREYMAGFDATVDSVAVAPFDSRNVANRIRAARFVNTLDEAIAQVNGLPSPSPTGNTALFSAISEGIDILENQGRDSANVDLQLVVLTDGMNDVDHEGDDRGLLRSLDQVMPKVRNSRVQVITIGLGLRSSDPREENAEIDLQKLGGGRYRKVNTLEDLKQAFLEARRMQASRLQVDFEYPGDRGTLAGRDHQISVSLRTSNPVLAEGTWLTPAMILPPFVENCSKTERGTRLSFPSPAGTACEADQWTCGDGWLWLRPILTGAGFALLLLGLWHGLPRVIWPGDPLDGGGRSASKRPWNHPPPSRQDRPRRTGDDTIYVPTSRRRDR